MGGVGVEEANGLDEDHAAVLGLHGVEGAAVPGAAPHPGVGGVAELHQHHILVGAAGLDEAEMRHLLACLLSDEAK